MTFEEAKEYGEEYLRDLTVAVCKVEEKHKNFVRMAIQALEEIQQYRAIGTVEDLKTMKENGAFTGVELAQILAMQMELKKYQHIGTVEEFKALKEKNVAKKPIRDKEFSSLFECPTCGRRQKIMYELYHCKECGQKLDWSE